MRKAGSILILTAFLFFMNQTPVVGQTSSYSHYSSFDQLPRDKDTYGNYPGYPNHGYSPYYYGGYGYTPYYYGGGSSYYYSGHHSSHDRSDHRSKGHHDRGDHRGKGHRSDGDHSGKGHHGGGQHKGGHGGHHR